MTDVEKGRHVTAEHFFARINNGTHRFVDDEEKQKFIVGRWPS